MREESSKEKPRGRQGGRLPMTSLRGKAPVKDRGFFSHIMC